MDPSMSSVVDFSSLCVKMKLVFHSFSLGTIIKQHQHRMRCNSLLSSLFILFGIVLLTNSISIEKNKDEILKEEFEEFIVRFNKKYESQDEFIKRFQIFKENKLLSIKYQSKLKHGNREGKVSVNGKFADMTHQEFKRKLLIPKLEADPGIPCSLSWFSNVQVITGEEFEKNNTNSIQLPESFDWRTKGVVTKVKNQGTYGLSWAFAAVENIESQWALAGKGLVSLSAQQLNDCDPFDCGLFGGWPCRAYQYIQKAGGVMAEKDYPYCIYGDDECFPCPPKGYNYTFCGDPLAWCDSTTWPCKAKGSFKAAAKISGYKWYKGLSEAQIQALLVKAGPINVMINSEGVPPLELHEYGVWSPYDCSETDVLEVDHAVLLVGYGVEKSLDGSAVPYWLMKNSWGTDWAEEGYFKMLRGSNMCGITLQVTSATI
eukprot:TRINITY_DN197_c0_g1_i3.p1 TRINITY_DN197_c0_g1~~TRINITY_DN197_c0_g1_i3.p1  ORF type:complete len:430 (+),score=132.39 TRINITY_DN197_c0_g1_i3:123-1412(+)